MAQQCPNCGAEGLRDEAQFCDTCGLDLGEASTADTLSPPAKTTLVEEGGSTRFVPEADGSRDEGSTRYVPEANPAEAESSTRFVSEADPSTADRSTHYLAQTGAEDRSTAPISDLDVTQDDEEARPAPQKGLLKAGHILQERYRLDRILGKGGFGAAYLVQDLKLKRRCVVKQMLTYGRSPREIEISRTNFEREANLLAELNDPGHPNIPEIYDYFSDQNSNYLVMKFIEGRNLQFVLDHDQGKIPWREAIRYAVDVVRHEAR